MENGGNRSHDPGEDLRSRGEAKTKSSELVHLAVTREPQSEGSSEIPDGQESGGKLP